MHGHGLQLPGDGAMTRFVLYAVRWQCSTPILWGVLALLGVGLLQTITANLIGAGIFFFVDRVIFGVRR